MGQRAARRCSPKLGSPHKRSQRNAPPHPPPPSAPPALPALRVGLLLPPRSEGARRQPTSASGAPRHLARPRPWPHVPHAGASQGSGVKAHEAPGERATCAPLTPVVPIVPRCAASQRPPTGARVDTADAPTAMAPMCSRAVSCWSVRWRCPQAPTQRATVLRAFFAPSSRWQSEVPQGSK